MNSNPRHTIAAVAREQLGVHETSDNQGPGIEKYWPATSYPEGYAERQPWCAAFACWCVQEAAKREPLLALPYPPRSAGVQGWLVWAQDPRAGVVVFKPHDGLYYPHKGDVVVFLPHFSHIGIVDDFDGRRVQTIEGNTNLDGSREGVEVDVKQRDLDICGYFLRLPCKAITADEKGGVA